MHTAKTLSLDVHAALWVGEGYHHPLPTEGETEAPRVRGHARGGSVQQFSSPASLTQTFGSEHVVGRSV